MKKVFAFVIALGLINLTSYSQEVAGAGSDSTAKTETVTNAKIIAAIILLYLSNNIFNSKS